MPLRNCVLAGLLLVFSMETYHAACIALDPDKQAIFLSDPFEQDCKGEVAACRTEIEDKWRAFLRKEGSAQGSGASTRCELFKEGARPGQSPRSRVRAWRDEEAAQAQAANPTKYPKVVMTTFQLD